MQEATLAVVGTNGHSVKLAFQGNQIAVYYDGQRVISATDSEAQPNSSGAVSVDTWTYLSGYTLFVDDMTVRPAAVEPTIASVGLRSGTSVITWNSIPGQTYRLQYKGSLGGTNWQEVLPDVTATGPMASATSTTSSSGQQFYRVIVVP
jgi:hypothetical protein